MKSSLSLSKIPLTCFIGIYPHEKTAKQTLLLDLSFDLTLPKSDSLSETIDYDEVIAVCHEVANSAYNLIETLAKRLVKRLQMVFDLSNLQLTLTKQLPNFEASVTIEAP